MSVLGAHVQALLKPLGPQHWLRGTSTPPEVARHTKALLTLENFSVGSNSCNAQGCIGRSQAHVRFLHLTVTTCHPICTWLSDALQECDTCLRLTLEGLPVLHTQNRTTSHSELLHQSKAAASPSQPYPSAGVPDTFP